MLWTEVLERFRGGDAEVVCGEELHYRGPLIGSDAMQFSQEKFQFSLALAWTKKWAGQGQWTDYEPRGIELDTTLTRIREVGGGRIRINMVVKKPPIPPSLTPRLVTIGEIVLHPPDEETRQWHKLVGAPVLATVV